VRTLQAGNLGGGRYVRVWDGRNDQGARVGTGVYFCRLSLKDFSATRKMVLLK
jgi:hypothetical protein